MFDRFLADDIFGINFSARDTKVGASISLAGLILRPFKITTSKNKVQRFKELIQVLEYK